MLKETCRFRTFTYTRAMKIGDTVIREVLSNDAISESLNIFVIVFKSNYKELK